MFATGCMFTVKQVWLVFNDIRILRGFSGLRFFVQVRVQLDVLADEDGVDNRSFADELDFAEEQQADTCRGDQKGAVECGLDVPPFPPGFLEQRIDEQIDGNQDQVRLEHEKQSEGESRVSDNQQHDFCRVQVQLDEAGQQQVQVEKQAEGKRRDQSGKILELERLWHDEKGKQKHEQLQHERISALGQVWINDSERPGKAALRRNTDSRPDRQADAKSQDINADQVNDPPFGQTALQLQFRRIPVSVHIPIPLSKEVL